MNILKSTLAAFLCCFICIFTSINISAQTAFNSEKYINIADSIVFSSLSLTRGYEWLSELCDIGPRLSGSEKSMQAIKWAEQKFKEIGVDSVWLQPVKVPHWVRGDIEKAVIKNSKMYSGKSLSVSAYGGSIGTPQNGVTGQVMEVHSFEELERRASEAKGKIIFYNRSFSPTTVETFRAYGEAVQQRTYGAIEAAKYGGIAAIVRSVTSRNDNVTHVGTMWYVDSLQHLPSAAIGVIDADFLSDAIKEDPALEVQLNLSCETLEDADSYNVIAEIKGTEYPNEIIVVGGHFDSWDKGCGAHDDGAPSIQTMEVLDLIKRLGLKAKRTIRCVLFINEENGLRGGLKYGEYSAEAVNEKHIAAIESDRGAFTPRGFSFQSEDSVVQNVQAWLPILNRSKIDWIRKGGSGGDISQIVGTKALIGYVPDDQRYFDFHHSDNDVYEAVNPREMQLGTAAITILAYLISQEGL